MSSRNLWLIPALPLLAAGLSALVSQRRRKLAAGLAIGSMIVALVLSCIAFASVVQQVGQGATARQFFNFPWFQFGESSQPNEVWVRLGWVLDPLAAVMLVMVCFVGLLIFI